MSKKKATNDAVDILYRRYYRDNPQRQAGLKRVRLENEVARKLYELRQSAGLSQRELADRVGTTASVVCRLEDADYEGHSLAMLHRIAAALNLKVEVNFVPIDTQEHST